MVQKTKRSCQRLLLEFKGKIKVSDSGRIDFRLSRNDNRDVYNITAPFVIGGREYIAGRVEARESEDSWVHFFTEKEGVWEIEDSIKPHHLQDPFVTFIDGELILGGVEVFPDPDKPEALAWRTIFLRGKSPDDLERFAKGPDRMKDIRLCQLPDRRILVLTRPQGEIGGRGKIGYLIIENLNELTADNLSRALILEEQFIEEEWGGANEIHLLGNGQVGVLSHIASFDDEGNRHYYSTVFCLNYITGRYSPMKIIAVRNNFTEGPHKRPDLADVIFSGGLIRKENNQAELYCGVSDAEGHKLTIQDPFAEYEI